MTIIHFLILIPCWIPSISNSGSSGFLLSKSLLYSNIWGIALDKSLCKRYSSEPPLRVWVVFTSKISPDGLFSSISTYSISRSPTRVRTSKRLLETCPSLLKLDLFSVSQDSLSEDIDHAKCKFENRRNRRKRLEKPEMSLLLRNPYGVCGKMGTANKPFGFRNCIIVIEIRPKPMSTAGTKSVFVKLRLFQARYPLLQLNCIWDTKLPKNHPTNSKHCLLVISLKKW